MVSGLGTCHHCCALSPSPTPLCWWTVANSVCWSQVERYAAGVRRFDFDSGLAPYDLASYALWRTLSGHVTEADVARLQPAGGAVLCISAEADPGVLRPSTEAEEKLYRQLTDGRAAAADNEAEGAGGGHEVTMVGAHMWDICRALSLSALGEVQQSLRVGCC